MSGITLVGSGNMARGIGTLAAKAGYGIQVLARDPDKAASLAATLSGATSGPLDAQVTGDIVVLAVPYAAVAEVVGTLGGALEGRTVVDLTNPVDFQTFAGLVTPPDSSGAEEIAKLLPGARVVKAFNTTFAATLADGQVAGTPLDVFIAGDEEAARKAVASFVEEAGLRPLDVGPLRQAHWLEGLALLHMGLQQTNGWGFNTAVTVVTP